MNSLTFAYRGVVAAGIGLAIALSMFAFATPALADQDPVLCSETGGGIALTVLRADGTTSVGVGTVSDNELIKYKATLSANIDTAVCAYQGGAWSITTPDGIVHDVTPGGGIPKIGGAGLTSLASTLVSYTVNHANETSSKIVAQTNYGGGFSHAGVSDSTGGPTLGTPKETTVAHTGHIIVNKVTVPSDDAQSFDFTTTGAGYADFSLTDAAEPNDQQLDLGSYSVSETPVAGWTQTSATCTDGQDQIDPSSITLTANQTVTCTFTNTKKGHIIVNKVTDPADDPTSFDFVAGGVGYSDFLLTDAADPNDQEVVPGAYTVSETPVQGWDSDGGVCDNGETPDSLDVEPGETVTCTFTNTLQMGQIILVKDVIGNPDPTDFTFNNNFGGDHPDTFQLDEDNNNDLPSMRAFSVLPGEYAVSEDPMEGWQQESATCDSDETVDSINVGPGETVTCTFVNEEYARIILIKNTTGGDGTFNFNATGDGLPELIELTTVGGTASTTFIDLDQDNTYSIIEDVPDGWDLSSGTCTGTNTPESITPDAGEVVTCTFDNTKGSTVIVKKVMVGGTDTFDFTGTPSGSISVNEGTISEDVAPGQYVSTEGDLVDNWELTDVSCDDEDSVGSVGDANATFNVEAGETVTCTFTNTYTPPAGNIIIIKQTDPDGDPQSFEFDSSYGSNFYLVDNGQNDSGDLEAGVYSVAEVNMPANWSQTSAICVSSNDDAETPGNISLQAGETVTCTFTNTYTPPAGEWCSPGYWRNHLDSWTGHDDSFLNALGFVSFDFPKAKKNKSAPKENPTLLDVLQSPQIYGGEAFNLVGDFLSGADPDVNFTGDRIEDSCPLN